MAQRQSFLQLFQHCQFLIHNCPILKKRVYVTRRMDNGTSGLCIRVHLACTKMAFCRQVTGFFFFFCTMLWDSLNSGYLRARAVGRALTNSSDLSGSTDRSQKVHKLHKTRLTLTMNCLQIIKSVTIYLH